MVVLETRDLGKRYSLATPDAATRQARRAAANFARRLLGRTSASATDPAERHLWALHNVDLEVRDGEVLGIIGGNGAGKSTLLKILSRITEPTTGWAKVRGRLGSLLEVGTGFHPELTGRDNIYLNGAFLGMDRSFIQSRFDEIVDFADIGQYIDSPVKWYSSGMYTRLAFAVAAHLEPDILIIDEVLSVGDAAFQKKSLRKMDEVAGEGRTVLFVSHNLLSVKSLCTRAIRLDHGEIVADGKPDQITADYVGNTFEPVTNREWTDPRDAPGSHGVRLVAVRARALSEGGELTIHVPLEIEVEYEILDVAARVDVVARLTDAHGQLLFTNGTHHRKSMPQGRYRSRYSVPANILNTGIHGVNLLMVRDGEMIFRVEDALSFDLGEIRQDYFGEWPGAFRLLLPWETDRVDEHGGAAPDAERISEG
jgi:lipopolysaccharide transport system ATP-binding protein